MCCILSAHAFSNCLTSRFREVWLACCCCFFLLITGIVEENWIARGANMLLSHLTLLFTPATVGVINYVELFSGKGMWSIVIVMMSTIVVMLFAGLIGQWSQTREQKRMHEVKGA